MGSGLTDRQREWLERLSELREKKKQELKELQEKKKQELEELEKKSQEELTEAEERFNASISGLESEEKQIIERLEKALPGIGRLKEENLEETISQEKIAKESTTETAGPIYQLPIEETVQQIYQNSNYNVYKELKSTLNKVASGEYLTRRERAQIYKQKEEIEGIKAGEELLAQKDPYGYVDRSKQVINSIEKAMNNSQYKSGDDH